MANDAAAEAGSDLLLCRALCTEHYTILSKYVL
jgi:hypothetical protein